MNIANIPYVLNATNIDRLSTEWLLNRLVARQEVAIEIDTMMIDTVVVVAVVVTTTTSKLIILHFFFEKYLHFKIKIPSHKPWQFEFYSDTLEILSLKSKMPSFFTNSAKIVLSKK